jgi:hypothetical protein
MTHSRSPRPTVLAVLEIASLVPIIVACQVSRIDVVEHHVVVSTIQASNAEPLVDQVAEQKSARVSATELD